jgi:FkbM family methyltransferase
MVTTDWMKAAIMRSPLEGLAKRSRRTIQSLKLLRHPELYDVWIEEARIERLIGTVVRDSSNCIDVGSHLGSILSLFVRHAPRGRHLAFEPNPQQAQWLKRKFPEAEVRQMALSNSAGEQDFYIREDRSGYSGLILGDAEERTRQVEVKVGRLDDLIGPDYRVGFLKVVVEGAELSVLQGAEEILRRDRPFLLFECIPGFLAQFGATPVELFEYLTDRHSYDIFLIKRYLDGGGTLDIHGFEDALRYPFKAFKFAAAPRSDLAAPISPG